MYGLLYECKFLTIEETNKKKKKKSFGPFGQAVSEEKINRNRPIRNKNCLWQPCLLMNRDEISNLYRGASKDAPYQVSVHLAKRFQRRRFFRNQPIRNKNEKILKNRPIRNKNCLWWPCLLMDQDKMSNL